MLSIKRDAWRALSSFVTSPLYTSESEWSSVLHERTHLLAGRVQVVRSTFPLDVFLHFEFSFSFYYNVFNIRFKNEPPLPHRSIQQMSFGVSTLCDRIPSFIGGRLVACNNLCICLPRNIFHSFHKPVIKVASMISSIRHAPVLLQS